MPIPLDPNDIRRLYGETVFIIPSTEEEKVPKRLGEDYAHIFDRGETVTWKMKPAAKLALILLQDEFGNKELTAALKEYILEAGISLGHIGFGVISGKGHAWDLGDMPVSVCVLFGGMGDNQKEEIPEAISLDKKDIFLCPSLAELGQHGPSRAHAVELLKQAKFLMQP